MTILLKTVIFDHVDILKKTNLYNYNPSKSGDLRRDSDLSFHRFMKWSLMLLIFCFF